MQVVKRKGAYAQLSDGTWMIDTKVKVLGKFMHFSKKGFATYSSANSAFGKEKQDFIERHSHCYSVITFDDLIREYKEMRKIVVKDTTLGCDTSVYNVYMYPYFKGKLLKDCFNKDSIKRWYHELVDTTKYSENKKNKVITRMKDLLKFAYMHEYIDAPTYQGCDVQIYQVKFPKRPAHERIVWSAEEEQAFYDATSTNINDYIMFKTFFNCSARIGEFLGLQGKCFNYDKKKITIKQQVLNVGGKPTLTERLKTHDSYRTVLLDDELCELLEDYIQSTGIKENDFIFYGWHKNEPMSRTTLRRKLYRYCELAGVRKINPHASRHLQATKLASVCHTGEEIEASARRLGHSPEMFLNTYARHTSEKTESTLLNRLIGKA